MADSLQGIQEFFKKKDIKPFSDIFLPVLAAAEVIGTKGQVPGTSALQTLRAFETARKGRLAELEGQEDKRNEEAERQIKTQLNQLKLSELQGDVKAQQELTERKRRLQESLKRVINPDEQRDLIDQFRMEIEPIKFLEARQKAEQEALKLEAITAAGAGKKINQRLANEVKILTRIDQNKPVRDFREVNRAKRAMEEVWDPKNPPKEGERFTALDQALITLFNKMIDPGSVVRESEFARTTEGLAVVDRMKGTFEAFRQGGVGLTNRNRTDLVRIARKLWNGALKDYKLELTKFENLRQGTGARFNVIFNPFEQSIIKSGAQSETTTASGKRVKF